MNENFFDQQEFLALCKTNNIEPMITGDNRLVLMCPKYPGDGVAEKFKAMIPQEVPWTFVEGLSQTTMTNLKRGLKSVGLRALVQNMSDHRVVVDINPPENHPLAGTTSPIWDIFSGILKKDPFVETFIIRVNGKVVRDSSQYVESTESSPIDDEGDYQEHNYQILPEAHRPTTRTPAVSVKDNRFEYDRPFLPKDVATDVKILLESTGSVEEFLKSI
jgi:hypothetical protein